MKSYLCLVICSISFSWVNVAAAPKAAVKKRAAISKTQETKTKKSVAAPKKDKKPASKAKAIEPKALSSKPKLAQKAVEAPSKPVVQAPAIQPVLQTIQRPPQPEELLSRFKPMLVKVFTAKDSHSQRFSLMSGLAVGPYQVATSSDLLAGLMLASSEPRVFIEHEGRISEAVVWSLDLPRRLLVLKTQTSLSQFVDRSAYSYQAATPAYFLGFGQAGIAYLDSALKEKSFRGGPVLDIEGHLLGVSQQDSSASGLSPSYFVVTLLGQLSKQPASSSEWRYQLAGQLAAHQERILGQLYDAVHWRLGNWNLGKLARSWTCESSKESQPKDLAGDNQSCSSILPLKIEDHLLGKVELKATVAKLPDSLSIQERIKAAQVASEAELSQFSRNNANQSQMTPIHCSQSKFKNDRGARFYVHYCTAGWKSIPGVNNTLVRFMSLDEGTDVAITSLHLNGFDFKGTTKLIAQFAQEARRGE